jgi:cholesterol transport system auxiliary component
MVPRYFSPTARSTNASAKPKIDAAQQKVLRLGRISASSHLRERMVYRDESGRVGYDEERRWTERPEAYLRRALSRALFEERGFKRTVTGTGPSLDVELVAFEELRGSKPVARLEAIVLLEDGRTSVFEQTVVVERPIERASDAERDGAVVRALSEALEQAVTQIADQVANATPSLKAPEALPKDTN